MRQSKKIKKTISLSEDTAERLEAHADLRHTSVSQLITDWIWKTGMSPGHDGPPEGWSVVFEQEGSENTATRPFGYRTSTGFEGRRVNGKE